MPGFDTDEEMRELVRLGLWALFAAAAMTTRRSEDAAQAADNLLAAAETRFEFLRPPADPTGGLLA